LTDSGPSSGSVPLLKTFLIYFERSLPETDPGFSSGSVLPFEGYHFSIRTSFFKLQMLFVLFRFLTFKELAASVFGMLFSYYASGFCLPRDTLLKGIILQSLAFSLLKEFPASVFCF
jgi:hypothetical protein